MAKLSGTETMTRVSTATPAGNLNDGDISLESNLCIKCGLCCTGAIYHKAVLEPHEIGLAKTLGLTVHEGDSPSFDLPCRHLNGTLCGIYGDQRPGVCGRYKCRLLKQLGSGQISFDDAVEKVCTARKLFSEAEAVMPDGMSALEARQRSFRSDQASDGKLDRTIGLQLKLRIIALNLYLDRHFRLPREELLTTTQ